MQFPLQIKNYVLQFAYQKKNMLCIAIVNIVMQVFQKSEEKALPYIEYWGLLAMCFMYFMCTLFPQL